MDDQGNRDAAPDLDILGDQVTLHPSGYVEPPERPGDGDRDRNLVEHMARFRSHPLEFVAYLPARIGLADIQPIDSSAKSPSMSPARVGAPTITS
jgi:hypothetical protein